MDPNGSGINIWIQMDLAKTYGPTGSGKNIWIRKDPATKYGSGFRYATPGTNSCFPFVLNKQ